VGEREVLLLPGKLVSASCIVLSMDSGKKKKLRRNKTKSSKPAKSDKAKKAYQRRRC